MSWCISLTRGSVAEVGVVVPYATFIIVVDEKLKKTCEQCTFITESPYVITWFWKLYGSSRMSRTRFFT
ncbi:hypothetical protein P692DRAFT_20343881, partial [Suillus brevipes Sb2]